MADRVDALTAEARTLETELAAGNVKAVLLFRGEWSAAEREAARQGWEAGLASGAAALESAEERANDLGAGKAFAWEMVAQEKARADAAEERVRELEARLQAKDAVIDKRGKEIDRQVARASRAEEALAAAEQALREYGGHKERCVRRHKGAFAAVCDCGWNAARAALVVTADTKGG